MPTIKFSFWREQVLPGLVIAIVEEALRRSREMSQSEVCTWLLNQFQQK